MPIFSWTGNPWVDGGISAIQEWSKKHKPEDILMNDIEDISKTLLDIYMTDSWRANLYSVFPNHPVTQSYGIKTKGIPDDQLRSNIAKLRKKQKEGFRKLLNDLTSNIALLEEKGNCIACGRRNVKKQRNRMHIPLTGYEGSHFFSYKTNGADYCDTCTFAVQCSPLLYYACGKLLLLHSNSYTVMQYWARRCIAEVHKQIATHNFSGCFNERYTNPINALFHITQDLILTHDEQWINENASIRIYHFTNYNQGPELDMYDLPSPIFCFLTYIRQHQRYLDWLKVVRKGYRNMEGKNEDEYRNHRNSVFTALLDGRSIINYFYDSKTKSVIGNWSLIRYYLKEVLSMNEKRIEAIRSLGDSVAEIIKTSVNGKRRLGQIERATSYASFRNVLLRLMRDSVVLKSDTPLLLFDDYTEHLFPDGSMGWKETQDLLLFRLYEILHDWLISEGVVKEEMEESEELVA